MALRASVGAAGRQHSDCPLVRRRFHATVCFFSSEYDASAPPGLAAKQATVKSQRLSIRNTSLLGAVEANRPWLGFANDSLSTSSAQRQRGAERSLKINNVVDY